MSIVFFLVPAALSLGLAFLAAFIWAARHGQFDDLDTPPLRVLLEETSHEPTGNDRR